MALFKRRKNKKFNYRPRYYEHDGEGSPFSIEYKFDKFRSTVGDRKGLKAKFKTAWADLKRPSDKNYRLRFSIVLIVLILFFLILIGFDLSIFFQ